MSITCNFLILLTLVVINYTVWQCNSNDVLWVILRACLSQTVPPFFLFSFFFPGQVKLSGSICRVSAPQGKDYFIMNPRTCWSFCWCVCQKDTCQKGQSLWRCLKCGKHWGEKNMERNRKREQTPTSVLHKRNTVCGWKVPEMCTGM